MKNHVLRYMQFALGILSIVAINAAYADDTPDGKNGRFR